MNDWIILEFEYGRYPALKRSLSRKGLIHRYATLAKAKKPNANAPDYTAVPDEDPIFANKLLKTDIVFVQGHRDAANRAMQLEYTVRVWRDPFQEPIIVPSKEMEAFTQSLAEIREAVARQCTAPDRLTSAEKKKLREETERLKKEWQENLAQFKAREFGKEAA